MGDWRAPNRSTTTAADVIAKIGFASFAILGGGGLLGLALAHFFPGNELFEALGWGIFFAPIALVTILPFCLILSALVRKLNN
jgi:hypothetical protein